MKNLLLTALLGGMVSCSAMAPAYADLDISRVTFWCVSPKAAADAARASEVKDDKAADVLKALFTERHCRRSTTRPISGSARFVALLEGKLGLSVYEMQHGEDTVYILVRGTGA